MGQTFPRPITGAMLAVANANAGKPRYDSMTDWGGGVRGDDVDVDTAAVSLARSGGGANEADYTPRTQAAKATALGTTLAVDVARGRGWIAPAQPYNGNEANPVAPVVTSLAPSTGAATSLPMKVTITGTGFSPWSKVYTGGASNPEATALYVSPTSMTVAIWKASPGTISVAVEDHGKMSNVDKLFTVT